MTDLQIWHFASGHAQSVGQEDHGTFSSDQAYVVLTQASDGQKLYLWAGSDAAKGTLATAAKHASELKETLDASYLRQQQGHETAEFKQLFTQFVVKPATEAEPAAAAEAADAPAAEPAVEDGQVAAEAEAEGEAEEAQAGAAAGSKKKKKKSKKKGGAAAAATAEPTAIPPPVSPEAAAPAADAADAADAAEGDVSGDAPAPAATPDAEEEAKLPAPEPLADEPASPQPAADQPQSPAPAAESPSPAEAVAASPNEEVKRPAPEAPTAATPAPEVPTAATPSPEAKPVPKGEVEEVGVESVSKAKEQLLSRLGSGVADSPALKQVKKVGTPRSTYLADSAKAWGGVAAAPPPTPDAKIKPGEKTFGVEELKGMRAEAGIDMTCKEAYLSDAEFEKVFGKDRAAFKAMPAWRQQIAKKQVGLW